MITLTIDTAHLLKTFTKSSSSTRARTTAPLSSSTQYATHLAFSMLEMERAKHLRDNCSKLKAILAKENSEDDPPELEEIQEVTLRPLTKKTKE